MSHNDDSRVPPSVPDEPVLLPAPEPLVPAEPLPLNTFAETRASGPLLQPDPDSPAAAAEPSWRRLLAAHPEEGRTPPPLTDTTIGSLGDEPMGGALREEPGTERPETVPEPAVQPEPPGYAA